MNTQHETKFLILDFGHPMTKKTVEVITNSLQNILALSLVFPSSEKDFDLGISVLNSDFTLIQSSSCLKKNFNLLTKNFDALNQTIKINDRVTVQEYKYLLTSSIETILRKVRVKSKTNSDTNQLNKVQIYMTLVTKKTATLLAEILQNVTRKLNANNWTNAPIKNIKIIQIVEEQGGKTQGNIHKNDSLIDWITYPETKSDVDFIFKDWLLKSDCEQQLEIILSREINLVIKCEVQDCVVNMFSAGFRGKFIPYNDLWLNVSNKQLDVINRIPTIGLCPTLVFGVPRRLFPTRNCGLSWTEIQTNRHIFRQLCRELWTTEQGLLLKSSIEIEGNTVNSFHFITSDGDMLLMNDVAPDELYLPQRPDSFQSDPDAVESATSVVKSSLQKVEFFEEFTPENFSSRLYKYLRSYLIQAGDSKSLFGHFDPNIKLFGRNSRKQSKLKKDDLRSCGESQDFYQPETQLEERSQLQKKRAKDSKTKNTHPALLSPKIVEKYRKVYPSAFNLPELGQDYNESFI